MAQLVKSLPATAGDGRDAVRSLCWEDTLEEGVETHSRMLAWRIPWTEEPGGLQPIALQRVRHDGCDLACTHAHHYTATTTGKIQSISLTTTPPPTLSCCGL